MSEDQLKRRLSALISADVVGYSRLMADDEIATIRSLTACRNRVTKVVRDSGGSVIDFVGDNMLAEFPNTRDAVESALRIHRTIADLNANLSSHRHLRFRIGIHLGDVMTDGVRLYGDGINIAARLEALADPGGICISDLVYRQIHADKNFEWFDLGEQELKNISQPVRVYKMIDPEAPPQGSVPATGLSKRPQLTPPAKPSLAVLPFVNLSADPDQDHFSDGLFLDIMTALVQVPGLFLISELSMLTYKSTPVSVRKLGGQLGVSHVLEGGIRRSGNNVRVTARLIETAGGRQVWGDRFDRTLDDIFAIQDDITVEIVTAMDIQLVSGEPGRIVHRALKSPGAIESFYKGAGALLRSSPEDIYLAREMFEKTIRLEPESSLGFAMAAWTCWLGVVMNVSKDIPDWLNRATGLAQQALDLNDVTGLAELVMAEIHLFNNQPDRALAASERAMLSRPSCDTSYAAKASVLNYLGRPTEAIELAQYAMRLSPVYPSYYATVLATAYFGSKRFEEAIAATDVTLENDPNSLDALLVRAAANAAMDRQIQAQEAAHAVRRIKPAFDLETYASSQPYKDPQHLEQLIGFLSKAGL